MILISCCRPRLSVAEQTKLIRTLYHPEGFYCKKRFGQRFLFRVNKVPSGTVQISGD